MIPNLPALGEAVLDRDLPAGTLRVLLVLALELNPTTFTPVKELSIRRRLGVGRTFLYASLKRLVALGYLEREGGGPGHVSAYRLAYQRVSAGASCPAPPGPPS